MLSKINEYFIIVIPKALNQTLNRRVEELEKRFKKSEFVDLSVKLQEPQNHLLITTLPSVLGNIHFMKLSNVDYIVQLTKFIIYNFFSSQYHNRNCDVPFKYQ